jgi:hypothetical protein
MAKNLSAVAPTTLNKETVIRIGITTASSEGSIHDESSLIV